MRNKIEYKDFLLVFEKLETMPKSKDELMTKLFHFYNTGIKNENQRIQRNLINLIINN